MENVCTRYDVGIVVRAVLYLVISCLATLIDYSDVEQQGTQQSQDTRQRTPTVCLLRDKHGCESQICQSHACQYTQSTPTGYFQRAEHSSQHQDNLGEGHQKVVTQLRVDVMAQNLQA